jgi:hypothetical protein
VNLLSIYRALLHFYPRDYCDAFAGEMLEAFESAAAERRHVGSEFAGLLSGAAKEWIAKLTTDRAVRGRCLPDLRMMRPAGASKEAWFSAAAFHTYKGANS